MAAASPPPNSRSWWTPAAEHSSARNNRQRYRRVLLAHDVVDFLDGLLGVAHEPSFGLKLKILSIVEPCRIQTAHALQALGQTKVDQGIFWGQPQRFLKTLACGVIFIYRQVGFANVHIVRGL